MRNGPPRSLKCKCSQSFPPTATALSPTITRAQQAQVKKAGSAEAAARSELLGRAGLGEDLGASSSQRERLLTANDRLQDRKSVV